MPKKTASHSPIANILIIDDKEGNIFALEKLLEGNGRTFFTASTGAEGLKMAFNSDIDLIILDVQMPGMDGFEVAQILKTNKKTKDIPIIFASAEKTDQEFMLKGFDEGGVDYLFKPLNPELTEAKVNAQLKIHLHKKELVEKNTSLEKSDLLINNSADIVGILDPASLRIEEVNRAFTSILGYPVEEVRGSQLSFYLNDKYKKQILRLTRTQEKKVSFEIQMYARDRSLKWLQWNVVVNGGKWFFNARDITEVKQGEKIKNYLAAFVKQSTDAVYIHDANGNIITWNEGAKQIYGYNEEEALKMKIWNIIPEHLLPEMQDMVGQIMKGERVQAKETKRITRNGKLIDVLVSATVITDDDDMDPSIAITERDITQQKIDSEEINKLNEELRLNLSRLEDSNKELESFSYSISHDLRAPLRALLGNVAIIVEDAGDSLDETMKHALSRIQYNSQKMNAMIDDLLDFSRLGKQELERTQINMSDMARKVIDDISDSNPHHADIRILEMPYASADTGLMSHLWQNLLSNAIKYSSKKEHPSVEVGAIKDEEGTVIYYVKDNGAGFDMTYANKLFGAFQRLHGNDYDGTGIGLAISQRIVTRHGGKIWADAKPNEGATFYFTLPVAA